eukprot:350208-Chlamydomonas_euryale.AAC.17
MLCANILCAQTLTAPQPTLTLPPAPQPTLTPPPAPQPTLTPPPAPPLTSPLYVIQSASSMVWRSSIDMPCDPIV